MSRVTSCMLITVLGVVCLLHLPGVGEEQVVSTVVGSAGNSGLVNASGSAARFYYPTGAAANAAGWVFVADHSNHVVRKVSPAGEVSLLAGSTYGHSDGIGAGAQFENPWAVVVDKPDDPDHPNFTIFLTDGCAVRRIDQDGTVTTIAGFVERSGSSDAEDGRVALFSGPEGLAVDRDGNVYVADTGNHTVRRISANGAVTTLAGSAGHPGFQDSAVGSEARFNRPTGIAVDDNGNLFVADSYNNVIRRITPTGAVSTFAGMAGARGSADGTGSEARFYGPTGLASDLAGNLYVVDDSNFTIRKITPGAQVSTVAGSVGNYGSSDGIGSAAGFAFGRLQLSAGLAVSPLGDVYVADCSNHTIRKCTPSGNARPVAFSQSVTVERNVTKVITLKAADPNGDPLTYGIVSQPAHGSLGGAAPAMTYTPVAGYLGADSFTFKANDGQTDSNVATVSISVALPNGAPIISAFSPASPVSLPAGTTRQFSVSVWDPDGDALSYSWSIDGVVRSTTDPSLTYSPLAAEAGSHTIRVSVSDGKGGLATQVWTVTVTSTSTPPAITTQPANKTVTVGQTATFTVVATGTAPLSYQWQKNGINISGATAASYTTPATTIVDSGAKFTVVVTNAAGSVTSNSATLTVTALTYTITATAGLGGTITPSGAVSVTKGGSQSFVIAASPGYQVASVTVDGAAAGIIYGYQFSNVTANHTIAVAFSVVPLSPTITFSTWAGSPSEGGSTNGVGTAARFQAPYGLIADAVGNVFVADTYNYTIRKIAPDRTVTKLAGSTGASGSTDGSCSKARFNLPRGIAIDSAGNLYVADTANHIIRKITTANIVSTLAGKALYSGSADGTGSTARFGGPWGLAVDAAGNVFVADSGNHTIRKITPAGVVTTLAGSAGKKGLVDGSGASARFSLPAGVAVDSAGNIYVADRGNNAIRKISPSGSVSTLAGSATAGSTDGVGAAARFSTPTGVALDRLGNVYVSDSDNATIRMITPSGSVTTVAGVARYFQYINGTGTAARFVRPGDIAVDCSGTIYVLDGSSPYSAVRRGSRASYTITASAGAGGIISPSGTVGVAYGSSKTFTITPNSGYVITELNVNGVAVAAASTYSFTNVQANQTISASFSKPPVAVIKTSATSALPGASVSFDGSSSSDPDGSIAAYAWDFGDGTTAAGAAVTHAFSEIKTYTVGLTVTDNSGAQKSTTVNIAVNYIPAGG